MSGRRSLLRTIIDSFKLNSDIRSVPEIFVGKDDYGNKYFERPSDESKDLKRKRRVEPPYDWKNDEHNKVPKLATEWMTWLQGRRLHPPSQQEIEQNVMTQVKTKMRAEELARATMAEDAKSDIENRRTQAKIQGSGFPQYPELENYAGEFDDKRDRDN